MNGQLNIFDNHTSSQLERLKEEWRPIPGFEGHYCANRSGEIKSLIRLWRTKELILRPVFSRGYGYVNLHAKEVKKRLLIHRLVARTFIVNPENKPEVNHKNGIKTDNRIENLEWCTRGENVRHSFKTGLKIVPFGPLNKTAKSVIQIFADGSEKQWGCMKDVQRELNISQGNISSACIGRYHTAGGYKWKFANTL